MRVVIGVDAHEVAGGLIEISLLRTFAPDAFVVEPLVDLQTQIHSIKDVERRAELFVQALRSRYSGEVYIGVGSGFVPLCGERIRTVRLDYCVIYERVTRTYRGMCNPKLYRSQLKLGYMAVDPARETAQTVVQRANLYRPLHLPKPR